MEFHDWMFLMSICGGFFLLLALIFTAVHDEKDKCRYVSVKNLSVYELNECEIKYNSLNAQYPINERRSR